MIVPHENVPVKKPPLNTAANFAFLAYEAAIEGLSAYPPERAYPHIHRLHSEIVHKTGTPR